MFSTSARGVKAAFAAASVTCTLLLAVGALAADVPIATVPVGRAPSAVAVDTVRDRVWVANFYGDSVTVIDSVTDTAVATVAMPLGTSAGAVPNAIVIDPLATPPKAYIANWQSHIVSFVNADTFSAIATITVPTSKLGNPRALALDPSSTPPKLYVANYARNVVSVLNASSGALIAEIPVGVQPRALGIFVSGTRSRVYVANRGSANVSVIDGAANSVVATLATGAGPKAIAVDPDSGRVYVTSPTSDTVTVIDQTDAVAATIAVGDNPVGVGVDTVGGRVFVANYLSNNVSVIDTATDSVVATVSAGPSPLAVSFDRGDRKAFVANYGGSTVTIIDRNLAVTTCTVGTQPYAIASNETLVPHKAYCANWGSDNVTVIDEPAPLTGMSAATVRVSAVTPGGDPIAVAIAPLSGDATTSTTPELRGTASSLRTPYASNIVAVLVSVDGSVPARAEIVAGGGTADVQWCFVPAQPLSLGSHRVEVSVFDQASAVSASSGQDQVSISSGPAGGTSYAFSVVQPRPRLDSLSPAAAAPGSTVTFSGADFGTLQGTGWVSFAGQAGIVVSWTDTQVVAQVPAGAQPGYAGVVQGGLASNGKWFTPAAEPVLTTISPASAEVGEQVVFAGTGFGAAQGAGSVTFAGTSAEVVSWTDTQVVARVPAGAQAGYAGVVQGGVSSNGKWFTPIIRPVVTGLSSWWAAPGTAVTVSGAGFGAAQGTSWVTFGGVPAPVLSWSDTAVTVTAPAGTFEGYVGVVRDGIVSNGRWLLVMAPPAIADVAPRLLSVGDTFTVDGAAFGAVQGSSYVSLGGVSVPVVSWSDTHIVATVPVGAVSGYVGVVCRDVTSNGVPAYVVAQALAPASVSDAPQVRYRSPSP